MARKPYEWPADGKPATIQQHSLAKHEVLHSYLIDYIKTVVSSPQQEELKLTMVDGFAGGGIYIHDATRQTVLGSPFTFLRAAEAAADVMNRERLKPIRMSFDYFFVERNADAHASLLRTLADQGYGARLGRDIHVFNTTFEKQAPAILAYIKTKNPRNGRSIFLLDQYGYTDVPASQIRDIFQTLPASEVILTFNVDSFLTYANDTASTKTLTGIGIPDVLRGRTIPDIKRSEKDWRLYIQSCLYRDLVEACGARYYTLFFIRTRGHGNYWLVHLSQHPRARDVMARVHWTKNNHFIHYGGAGIDMFRVLGYSADRDSAYTRQGDMDGFCFDDVAETSSITMLMEQLPHMIYAHDEGLSFGELFATTCNLSPADSLRYKEALARLVQHRDIAILGPDGERRLKATTITDKDQLIRAKQSSFGFL